ncbi:hypothetical protein PVAND_017682 [Polypedilum vanderplanki]|uniref:Uncharacterized protein n=1 Tax=Polypedilum vanderplanki TaxID=319348 RepID=A0A9J6B9I9_POLVA|nr:hypothetical protein PVAND_017682 [Polypedilum vanderplanki]
MQGCIKISGVFSCDLRFTRADTPRSLSPSREPLLGHTVLVGEMLVFSMLHGGPVGFRRGARWGGALRRSEVMFGGVPMHAYLKAELIDVINFPHGICDSEFGMWLKQG